MRVARELFAAGEVAEMEVNLTLLEANRAEERALAARQAEMEARAALALVIGIPAERLPPMEGGLEALELPKRRWMTDELVEIALRRRPDLQASRMQRQSEEAAVQLARAEGRPNVEVGLAFIHERSDEQLRGRTTDNLLGLRVAVPLPSPRYRQARVQEAAARRTGTEHRQAALHREIVQEVETAAQRLETAAAALHHYRTGILPQAEENLQTVRAAYQLGEVEIFHLLNEQRRYFEVNRDHLQALYRWNIALAALQSAIGTDLNTPQGGRE